MIQTIVLPEDEIANYVVDSLQHQLSLKPDSTLGLATGSTPLKIYAECIKRVDEGRLNFEQATSFNLDEYVGLPEGHPESYRTFMNTYLFDHVNFKSSNTHIPNGNAPDLEVECMLYERLIRQAQGIDWQLLGIGMNGHIGFNEPADSLYADTHVVQLAEETREANSRFFASIDEVPRQAVTIGMGPILRADTILLVAIGKSKAEAVRKALLEDVTTWLPASFLQLHGNATFVLDQEAASLLD